MSDWSGLRSLLLLAIMPYAIDGQSYAVCTITDQDTVLVVLADRAS